MCNFAQVRFNNISLGLTLVAAAVAVASTSAQAQSLTTLYSFCQQNAAGNPCQDGASPLYGAPLALGSDGNFYGVTSQGGSPNSAGTVFKITPAGDLTTLYPFCPTTPCTDGNYPLGGLAQGTDGNFYGTTNQGGSYNAGTIFKITPTGVLTKLYDFCSQSGCADGASPSSTLVLANDGNFYGTTGAGGSGTWNGLPDGTVFKITPSGTLTTLHSFCSLTNCADGVAPFAPLIQASDGNFYGATSQSGVPAGGGTGGGTIFQITPGGVLTTLYTFCSKLGCADGANDAYAGLVQASDGNFYGTTINGGSTGNGTIFSITPSGNLTTLYNFTCSQGSCPNGSNPYAGLTLGTDGNFYGTAFNGGASGLGTIFTITPTGALTTLYNFCSQTGCTDGAGPYSGVAEGNDGNLYGATQAGGTPVGTASGTVYMLATNLPVNTPAVTLSPTSLNFGMEQVGGAYPIPQVQLTDSGTGPLTISSIQKTGNNPGDFSQSNNCPTSPSTLGTGLQCTFAISFTPSHLGPLSAAVSISTNASGSPQSIALAGTAVDFSVSAVPVSNTIKGGKAATYNISVTPLGGNTMTANLSVSGCPANATCTLSASQLALNGSTASSSTLTVKGNGKTAKGLYTLTINGQVFTVKHSTTASLTVQ